MRKKSTGKTNLTEKKSYLTCLNEKNYIVDPNPEEPELPPPFPFFPPFTFQKRLKFKSASDFFFFRRPLRREAMPLARRPDLVDPLPDIPQRLIDEFLARLEDMGRRSLPELPELLPLPLIPFVLRTSNRPSAVRGR